MRSEKNTAEWQHVENLKNMFIEATGGEDVSISHRVGAGVAAFIGALLTKKVAGKIPSRGQSTGLSDVAPSHSTPAVKLNASLSDTVELSPLQRLAPGHVGTMRDLVFAAKRLGVNPRTLAKKGSSSFRMELVDGVVEGKLKVTPKGSLGVVVEKFQVNPHASYSMYPVHQQLLAYKFSNSLKFAGVSLRHHQAYLGVPEGSRISQIKLVNRTQSTIPDAVAPAIERELRSFQQYWNMGDGSYVRPLTDEF